MWEICAPSRAHGSGAWNHGQCEDICIALNSTTPKTGTLILQYNKSFGWQFSFFFSGSCLMGLLVIFSIGTAFGGTFGALIKQKYADFWSLYPFWLSGS